MQRLTKDNVKDWLKQFEPRFDTFNEILDPSNSIDAAKIMLGFEVINMEGYTSYVNGGYLIIDEDGYPKGFTFREFEDTFLVGDPSDLESISGLQKLGNIGEQQAPADGPDAVSHGPGVGSRTVDEAVDEAGDPVDEVETHMEPGEGRTVESIGPEDVGKLKASDLMGDGDGKEDTGQDDTKKPI